MNIKKYLKEDNLNEQSIWRYVGHSLNKITQMVSSRLGERRTESYEDVLKLAEDMGGQLADELKDSLKSGFDMKGTNINKAFKTNEINEIYKRFIKGMRNSLK